MLRESQGVRRMPVPTRGSVFFSSPPTPPDHLNVFLDLSEVDSLPGTGQISTVVNEVKKLPGRVRFGACVILATRDALFGMMRVFEVMGEEYFRVMRTFRVANEAEAWLVR